MAKPVVTTEAAVHKRTASRIAKETTLTVHDAYRYLRGGLSELMIGALCDLASSHALPTDDVVRAFFDHDPATGYKPSKRYQQMIDDTKRGMLNGTGEGNPVGILNAKDILATPGEES